MATTNGIDTRQEELAITPARSGNPANVMAKARESFSGRLLSDAQFDEAIAITRILEREIYRSGAFKDKLKDYSFAMARSDGMDIKRAEGTIRDLFRERTGQTMNQLREALMAREESLDERSPSLRDQILTAAHGIELRMADGDKITFGRASAEASKALADDLGITDRKARFMMRDAFEAEQGEHGLLWTQWGEKLDETYYRPQIEKEKQARLQVEAPGKSARLYSRSRR